MLAQGGGVGLLVLFIAGLFTRKIVWGSELVEMRKDRDEWKHLSLELLQHAETIATAVKP